MSQAEKILKGIAAGEDYKALAAAVESKDYEAIGAFYPKIGVLLKDGKKEVLDKLQGLSRQNKEMERINFETAYARRISSDLPAWHQISCLLREKGIAEAEVYALGKKGDPLVRSADGQLVVVTGSKAQPGTRITFVIDTKGEKLSFGREVQPNGDLFYNLLNSDLLDGIKKAMDSIEARLKALADKPGRADIAELSQLLTDLNKVKEDSEKLRESERARYLSRVQIIRRKLLGDWVARSIFDFLAGEEDREIASACKDEQAIARARQAPGLFRRDTHNALKTEIFAGAELKGYAEAVAELERDLDSMDAAMKLMEFKSSIDDIVPLAKRYVERMDVLYDNINRRARRVGLAMSEDSVCSAEDIDLAVRSEFAGKAICSELRSAFRNADEFFAMRDAVAKIRTLLAKQEGTAHEAAIKPYLVLKTSVAFPSRKYED